MKRSKRAPFALAYKAEEALRKAVAEAIGRTIVDRKDAPILAAAQNASVDFLITLDKKHFLNPKTRQKVMLKVVSPIEFLQLFEKLFLEE